MNIKIKARKRTVPTGEGPIESCRYSYNLTIKIKDATAKQSEKVQEAILKAL